jgi:hypothetical protein
LIAIKILAGRTQKPTDKEIDKIVPGSFEVEESEYDEEAETTWMDLVGVAFGQINLEPPIRALYFAVKSKR